MRCLRCRFENDTTAKFCIKCGWELSKPLTTKKSKNILWIFIPIFVVVVFVMIEQGQLEQQPLYEPTIQLPEPTPTPYSLNGYRPRCPYNIQETLSRLNRAYDQLLYESSSWVTDKTTADLAAALIIGKEIINNDNCRKNDELRDRIRTIEIEIRQRTLDNLSH